jgi:HAD superfamily phosphatase (TIGR01668 family)
MVDCLDDIDLAALKQAGIRGIIFDLDNTIIPWGSNVMDEKVRLWLDRLIKQGFKVSLVSNNKNKRVKEIGEKLSMPFVARALKPAKTGFRQALVQMGLAATQAAVIGDQLFTDVLGGNRLGLYTIWVRPLSSKEFIGTKVHRQFEKLAVRILKAKGLIK